MNLWHYLWDGKAEEEARGGAGAAEGVGAVSVVRGCAGSGGDAGAYAEVCEEAEVMRVEPNRKVVSFRPADRPRESAFKTASRMVDECIRKDGVEVSAEERNKRVQAVEFLLRQGKRPEDIDVRAVLFKVSMASLLPKDLK